MARENPVYNTHTHSHTPPLLPQLLILYLLQILLTHGRLGIYQSQLVHSMQIDLLFSRLVTSPHSHAHDMVNTIGLNVEILRLTAPSKYPKTLMNKTVLAGDRYAVLRVHMQYVKALYIIAMVTCAI